ncbi:MAG: hypothetical protein AAF645_00530 [Myxococcota bacterium]
MAQLAHGTVERAGMPPDSTLEPPHARWLCVQLDDDAFLCSEDEAALWMEAPPVSPMEERRRSEKRKAQELLALTVWLVGTMALPAFMRAFVSDSTIARGVFRSWFLAWPVGILVAFLIRAFRNQARRSNETTGLRFRPIAVDVAGLRIAATTIRFDEVLAHHVDGNAVVVDFRGRRPSLRLKWTTLAEAEAFARRIEAARREFDGLRHGRAYRFARRP